MKRLFLLVCFVSCAELPRSIERPSWVTGIRSGEEQLKVTYANKFYYRRIAGGPTLTKQTSCELVVMKGEEDIKKEFPLYPNIPYRVEILFYDREYKDCAVTLSISSEIVAKYEETKKQLEFSSKRKDELMNKTDMTADEATEILQMRSQIAMEFALTGLTREEFEKYSKEKVVINEGNSMCSRMFLTSSYSVHGTTHVCWSNQNILGYCTIKDQQCWKRTP